MRITKKDVSVQWITFCKSWQWNFITVESQADDTDGIDVEYRCKTLKIFLSRNDVITRFYAIFSLSLCVSPKYYNQWNFDADFHRVFYFVVHLFDGNCEGNYWICKFVIFSQFLIAFIQINSKTNFFVLEKYKFFHAIFPVRHFHCLDGFHLNNCWPFYC